MTTMVRTGARPSVGRAAVMVAGVMAVFSALILASAPSAGAAELPPPIVLAGSPYGTVDTVVSAFGGIGVAGWAVDPSTTDPIDVHVYVDGTGYPDVADYSRPDVEAAYPGVGEYHGFVVIVPADPGTHQVCVYGINVGMGGNQVIGCRQIVVPDGSPVGFVDAVTRTPGGYDVSGWAIDPETADPIDVHLYVDGWGTAVTADADRPDIDEAFPGYGPYHGYVAHLSAPPGPRRVCAYAINVEGGGNSLLGCRTVGAFFGDPVGSLDVAAGGSGAVHVAGWAIDPETNGSIDVHVYVDGSGLGVTANVARPDVSAAFPGYGPAQHGFDTTIPAAPGEHRVCAYGINVSAGGNSLLGCRTVVVT